MEPTNSTKKSEEPLVQKDSNDLEFPDWSGMDDSSARISAEAAFRLCEQYPALFFEQAAKLRDQAPEKCLVEFVL